MSFEKEWENFKKEPIKYTLHKLNEAGETIGLKPDPTAKKETYTPIARYDGSDYLNPTAMTNEQYYHEYVESLPNGTPLQQIQESGKGTPNEINTASIDNFIPNTANGGKNMATEEDKNWLERNGLDPTKLLTTAITMGGNYINQQQQNKFNAEEAKKNREFEERLSNTAFQRQANDMKLAGVNPVASAEMGGASTPSGATASGTTPYYADPLTMANTALVEAQTKNMNANSELAQAQAGKTEEEKLGIEIENEYKPKLKQLEIKERTVNTEKGKAEIAKAFSDIRKNEKEVKKMDQEIAILKDQGRIVAAQRKTIERNRRLYAILDIADKTLHNINQMEDVILKPFDSAQDAMSGAMAGLSL